MSDSRFLHLLRGPWPIALALFVGSLLLFTRDNGFSFSYHPDEDGKTFQIIQRERNFHHPLLLLNVTDLAVHLARVPLTSQTVVIAGRWVSAAFAAGAVAALAVIGFYRGGWLAAWAVGLLVATHGKLYEAAHYFKEDTALVFGLAIFFLAAELFSRAPTPSTLRVLGFASALATSGKYVGVLALLFAIPLVWRAGAVPVRWKTFTLAFVATFLVLNIPPTTHPSSPFRSLKREIVGVTEGHRGMTQKVPHAKYVPELREDVSRGVLVGAAIALLAVVVTARKRSGAEWVIVLFPIVYFAVISCSPKTGGRYLLPTSTLICALGGLGVIDFTRFVLGKLGCIGTSPSLRLLWNVAVAGSALPLLAAFQLPLLRVSMDEFRHDDRVELAEWIRVNVPNDAIVVEDHRVNLFAPKSGDESGKPQVPQRVLDNDYAADLGTLDEMRTWGIVYVAVSQRAYDRFFSKNLQPRDSEKADYARRKEFYTRLFAEAELVREFKSQGNIYLQPGLRLYKLEAR